MTLYTYDALGRRVMKTPDAGAGGLNARIRFIYGGLSMWQVVEEWNANAADDPLTPNVDERTLATYVWGNYIDELVAMRRDTNSDGTPEDYFYHCDDLYNVTAVTDINGAVVEYYDYGAYGFPLVFNANGSALGSSAINNPYMFTGRRFDLESRFYYYRTRYYEPTLGRFTTRDTIGIWGDPANLGNASNYVASNPWTWVDPWGFGSIRSRPLRRAPDTYFWHLHPSLPIPIVINPVLNSELEHHHVFYDDGQEPSNEGFFPRGVDEEKDFDPDEYLEVVFEAPNDAALREAVRRCKAKAPFCDGGDGYRFIPVPFDGKTNCQGFADCVIDEYKKLTTPSRRCTRWEWRDSPITGPTRVCREWTEVPPEYPEEESQSDDESCGDSDQ